MGPKLPPPHPQPPPYIKKRNRAIRKMHEEKKSATKIKSRHKNRFVKMSYVRKGGKWGKWGSMGKGKIEESPKTNGDQWGNRENELC